MRKGHEQGLVEQIDRPSERDFGSGMVSLIVGEGQEGRYLRLLSVTNNDCYIEDALDIGQCKPGSLSSKLLSLLLSQALSLELEDQRDTSRH